MLYNTIKKLKARGGLTADLIYKIDIFFALGCSDPLPKSGFWR